MGEAWFMSEQRKFYTELMDRGPEAIQTNDASMILFEITSGISSFGPLEEWRSWFHYLLPRLTRRAFDRTVASYLVESLVSGFVANYPATIVEPYRGFRQDVLSTLPVSIMSPTLWSNGSIRVGKALCERPRKAGVLWGWYEPSGDFSSLMYFCLKYLDVRCLDGWAKSLLSIRDPHWGAQVLAWLVAFYRLLDSGINQPVEFDRVHPDSSWESSGCLRGNYTGEYSNPSETPFLPQESIEAFLAAIKRHVNEDLVLRWAAAFADFPYLEAEAYAIPDEFLSLHRARADA